MPMHPYLQAPPRPKATAPGFPFLSPLLARTTLLAGMSLLLSACSVASAWNETLLDETERPSTQAPSSSSSELDISALGRPHAAGYRNVAPAEVARHLSAFHVIDVREPYELRGPLAALPEARSIPLGRLRDQTPSIPDDKPMLLVCRSGNRSAQGCAMLRQATGRTCYNLQGGMAAWTRDQPRP